MTNLNRDVTMPEPQDSSSLLLASAMHKEMETLPLGFGDVFHQKRLYQQAYRQDIRDRVQSALSELIRAGREHGISEDVLVANIEFVLAAMVENEVASYVEDWLEPALSVSTCREQI